MAAVAVAISLDRLTKFYGKQRGVVDLTLEVRTGEVFGFLGPNGAGKTTTIRVLLDLIRATSGRAEALGLDTRRDAVALHRRLSYLPGDLALYEGMTSRELLVYLGNLRGGARLDRIRELADRFDLDLDRPIRTLSKGNKQKVGIVQAFAPEPELFVLDEPTGGLDPLMQQQFNALVRETVAAGRTVLLSSHLLSEVQHVAQRVAILREGRLVALEEVARLHERAVRIFELRFAGPAPREALERVPGVGELTFDGSVARLRLEGSPDPLVRELARHDLVDLVSHEPDLEEVFLSFYSDAP
jgi:beta-exotoxin I transport system ATP-binding protein